MSSCSNMIIAESVDHGRTVRLPEANNITVVGDTIVIRESEYGRQFYGRYKGKLPKSYSSSKITVTYNRYVRIK